MRLEPYVRVDDFGFDATPAAVLSRRGRPRARRRNSVGLDELDYGEAVYRFQASGRLEEVTRRAPVLYLLDHDVVVDLPFAALAPHVRRRDADAFERAGFLVSPRYGLAFVPAEPDWVTALARHCIGTWRALPASPPG